MPERAKGKDMIRCRKGNVRGPYVKEIAHPGSNEKSSWAV